MIPLMGYQGAAWATLICYVIITVLSYLLGQKHFPAPYTYKRLAFLVGCTGKSKEKGISMDKLDRTAVATEDFYQFATGGWQAANPIPAEYSRYGSFDKLAEDNQKQVLSLIETLSKKRHASGSNADKIGTLFAVGMDTTRLNEEGTHPVAQTLEQILNIPDKDALLQTVYQLHSQGFAPYFHVFSEADSKNSTINIAWLSQGSLGMGDRDYYLQDDARSQRLREVYNAYVEQMVALFSADNVQSFEALGTTHTQAAASIINTETALAKIMMPREEFRNPHHIYNKMSVEQLKTLCPFIQWDTYFASLGLSTVTELSVATVDYMKNLSKLVQTTSLNDLKLHLFFNYIQSVSPYLSQEVQDIRFEYYGKALQGTTAQQPRWKIMVSTIDGSLGEAVGQEYVKVYFPESSKTRMVGLVENLRSAFSERITNLDWMSDETKAQAQGKLAAFKVKIGYPNKWQDYSKLVIDAKETYVANMLRVRQFEHNLMIEEIDKPVDAEKWLMNAHQVNAYYNPTTNEICFPAGILQPPFFYANGDDASNYGAIGVVIAHEMTHGFDDQGRQYDKEGNLRDWWTAEDAKRFESKAKVLVDWFDSIEVAPGVYARGSYQLGENLADFGGVQIAFHAFQKTPQYAEGLPIEEFTPAQRFFLAYSGVWAGNIRDEEILRRTKTDVHALGKWRVNGTLPHSSAFHDAFDVKQGDQMFLAPDKRASIW
ncbi:peptidase M13 [Bacteroidia bacterium]|nr:peptidase M13 [Bacteroidia bacterium]